MDNDRVSAEVSVGLLRIGLCKDKAEALEVLSHVPRLELVAMLVHAVQELERAEKELEYIKGG